MAKKYKSSAYAKAMADRDVTGTSAQHYSGKEGMINSDYSAHANLPQGIVHKMYPYAGASASEDLNMSDNVKGIDYQIKSDEKLQKRGAFNRKY